MHSVKPEQVSREVPYMYKGSCRVGGLIKFKRNVTQLVIAIEVYSCTSESSSLFLNLAKYNGIIHLGIDNNRFARS